MLKFIREHWFDIFEKFGYIVCVLGIFSVCAFLMLGVCNIISEASKNEEERVIEEYNNYSKSITIWVDKDTGVNYLVYKGFECVDMLPRYNADGTLYVDKE